MEKSLMFLGKPENRKKFFRRIEDYLYPPSDWRYQLIEKAYSVAKDAFREKYRETGERYFEHLRRTALIQIELLFIYRQPKAYILIGAALLHDLVEDIKGWTIERVAREFCPEIAQLLDWLTKGDPEAYHRRFINAPRDFFLVKFPDRLDNLLTIWGCPVEKIWRKIEETEKYYLPYAELHNILAQELHEAVAQAKKFARAKMRRKK
jgi:GTP diphosphokinase / guanosine-3',5'-bis(diphosphate) 3'-diphosphatase